MMCADRVVYDAEHVEHFLGEPETRNALVDLLIIESFSIFVIVVFLI